MKISLLIHFHCIKISSTLTHQEVENFLYSKLTTGRIKHSQDWGFTIHILIQILRSNLVLLISRAYFTAKKFHNVSNVKI